MITIPNLKYRKIRYLMHILFWTGFVLLGSFISSYDENFPYRFFLLNFIINIPVYVLYTYFNVYVLIYRFLWRKKNFLFIVLFPATILFFSFFKLAVTKFVFYQFFIPNFLHPEVWLSLELIFINVVWLLAPLVVFVAIKFYKDWVNSLSEKSEIEKRKLESELQLLKAQLNPHFLFNTLNNLYVLALQKNEKTPEIIAKISDLFHYILYECNATKVPLDKEIKLIENYIELEQIRYEDRLNLKLKKNIKDEGYLIPPMLLFTFVENCFKHGSSDDPGVSWIRLKIDQEANCLDFEADNSIPENGKKKKSKRNGVGLANISKRLELMYPGSYELNVKEEKTRFQVQLHINNGYE